MPPLCHQLAKDKNTKNATAQSKRIPKTITGQPRAATGNCRDPLLRLPRSSGGVNRSSRGGGLCCELRGSSFTRPRRPLPRPRPLLQSLRPRPLLRQPPSTSSSTWGRRQRQSTPRSTPPSLWFIRRRSRRPCDTRCWLEGSEFARCSASLRASSSAAPRRTRCPPLAL